MKKYFIIILFLIISCKEEKQSVAFNYFERIEKIAGCHTCFCKNFNDKVCQSSSDEISIGGPVIVCIDVTYKKIRDERSIPQYEFIYVVDKCILREILIDGKWHELPKYLK